MKFNSFSLFVFLSLIVALLSACRKNTSSDRGQTWSQVVNGLAIYSSVTAMLIHNDTVMVAGNGIFRSIDFGQTWTQLGVDWTRRWL